MKAAVCVGHSRTGDSGAVSAGGQSEWLYNVPVAAKVEDLLTSAGVNVLRLDEYQGAGYSSSMSWLSDELDRFGADCALELHFNAANKKAQGFEYLYWHSSSRGKELAAAVHRAHSAAFGGVDRGVKPKTSADRGSGFLSGPACPSIICEPFFGDNPSEWREFGSESAQEALAHVYAAGILDFLGADSPSVDQRRSLQIIESIRRELNELEEICRKPMPGQEP